MNGDIAECGFRTIIVGCQGASCEWARQMHGRLCQLLWCRGLKVKVNDDWKHGASLAHRGTTRTGQSERLKSSGLSTKSCEDSLFVLQFN